MSPEQAEEMFPLVKAQVRVALPVVVKVEQHGLILEEGRLLHVRHRLAPDAMHWALMVYTAHFPENEAHKFDWLR